MIKNSNTFAHLYHAHHSQFQEDLRFWLELAKRKAGTILELGCGTGRVSIALAKQGFHVIGLDINAGMLSVFKEQLQSETGKVGILQADLTKFHIALPFALIVLPCNTFSTLSSPERSAALRCVHQHLSPDGLFAVSLPNPLLLSNLARNSEPQIESAFLHPKSGNPVQVSSSWRRSKLYFTLQWNYDHLLPDGRVERLTTQVRHHIASIDTLLGEFRQADLQINALFGDYDGSKVEPDSPQLIICAEKN